MHLLLNNAGGIPANQFPANETNRGGSSVSTFSLLLAGKLAGPVKGDSDLEHGAERGQSSHEKGDSDSEALVTDRPDTINNPDPASGSRSGEQVSGGGMPSMTGESGSLGSLASLLFNTEATAMGIGAATDNVITDGVPVDFRSRLAGDIAAGFSNRNGIQTLVLKLDSDHLGQVDVRLQAKDDHLSVRLLAANRESEAALRGNIKELSEAIQKRTGRFQHVEVRVELKSGEDPGREPRDEDPEHSSGHHSHEQNNGDPDTQRDPEYQNATEFETGPDNRAQGG